MSIPEITSLDQLQYNLSMGAGYDGYTQLIKAVDLPDEELDKICRWKPERYTRICVFDSTEAVRVVRLLPQLEPAKQRGRPARMSYIVPITAVINQ